MEETASRRERWRAYRPSKELWFWSCIASVIATMIIGFHWGGWVTGGSATHMAANAANKARAQVVAALCVKRFESAPNAAAELATLKKTDSWDRTDFISKGGWVTVPGGTQPVSDAAGPCVQKLLKAKLPVAKVATKATAKTG